MGTAQSAGFANWVTRFRPRALNAGISGRIFDAAFASARYLPETVQKDRNQSEFVKPLADYMATAASDDRVTTGRAMLRKHASLLNRIEARFGVDPATVLASGEWRAILANAVATSR